MLQTLLPQCFLNLFCAHLFEASVGEITALLRIKDQPWSPANRPCLLITTAGRQSCSQTFSLIVSMRTWLRRQKVISWTWEWKETVFSMAFLGKLSWAIDWTIYYYSVESLPITIITVLFLLVGSSFYQGAALENNPFYYFSPFDWICFSNWTLRDSTKQIWYKLKLG